MNPEEPLDSEEIDLAADRLHLMLRVAASVVMLAIAVVVLLDIGRSITRHI